MDSNRADRYVIKKKGNTIIIDCKDITYCQADNTYSHLYTNNGGKYTETKPLKQVASSLNQLYFIRISQSVLVNVNYIAKVEHDKKLLIMKDNTGIKFTIPIKDLQRQIDSYLKNESNKKGWESSGSSFSEAL